MPINYLPPNELCFLSSAVWHKERVVVIALSWVGLGLLGFKIGLIGQ